MKRNHIKEEEKNPILLRWRRSQRETHEWNACMHTDNRTTVFRSHYSGYRHNEELLVWILVTPFLMTFNLPLFLMHTGGLSCNLQSQREKHEIITTRTSCSVSYIIYLSFTHVLKLTWEMSIPVSFSTAEGSFVMISSTSPASLAAPTSELPLDTIVILWAADSGLLISSAICGREWIRKLIQRRQNPIQYMIWYLTI